MPFVPVVDLTDPECEPSDEELEALMQSVCEKVIEREARTQERFETSLAESIARAAQGGTGPAFPDRRKPAPAQEPGGQAAPIRGTLRPTGP